MKVFTYYDNFKNRKEPLIDLWKESWSKHGWEPTMLTPDDAKRDSNYRLFVDSVSRLPTINNRKYELACYARHLAMSVVGGGLLTDYDVMCYGFTPQMMAGFESDHAAENFIGTLNKHGVPCAIFGRRRGFEWFCSEMMNWSSAVHRIVRGKAHLSDMIICQRLKLHREDICAHYLTDGWEKALLVHFAGGQCQGHAKHELIRAVRPP